MSQGTPSKKGQRARKYGRGLRKPAHKRYVAEDRKEKNKARKQARIKKVLARKAARKAAE